jgi:hypothetical protein
MFIFSLLKNRNKKEDFMKFNIMLTASKLFAFLVLVLGFVFGIVLKDSSIFATAITTGGLVIGVKTGVSGYVESKKSLEEATTESKK